ncbi:chemotaxis protein CheB [Flavobacterium noncentrifugens]|uniref:protein-glutamate methylesterase n=1 Tax=Flavobacterium noncentrifugens TaxID=1128970 RepID=A0A1G8YLM1_9FLAO|nr:chemotaxis protein CheB [Flavobacterium noncentrifugens]GEP51263.1 chemotaxis protein CheB [Flavobacterium noncentrifugens]SDK03364.1 two-component system, chemotaxis family, response regulator CheB [Flavobacterium noncentrifugens]
MEEAAVNNNFKVLIIGGSAGSLEVLIRILPQLTAIPFALVIVLHRKAGDDSMLEELIAAKTTIPVMEVDDKTPLVPGSICIAPSDYHLLFEKDDILSLDASEKINFSRPSIDVSFESAAEIYGSRLTAILLSGANSDGTNGAIAIKNAGGMVVIQKPESASMSYMPNSAIQNMVPDYILDVDGILDLIHNIVP